jgi:hypothetical protein
MNRLPWILTVDHDILPIISPKAPDHFIPINPRVLSKSLGKYDLEKWKKSLKPHRVNLIEHPKPRYPSGQVGGGLDNDNWRIYLDLLMREDGKPCDMRFHVIQTILHEMIHADQFSKGGDRHYYRMTSTKTVNRNHEYLARIGEVKAFAHCSFLEFQNEGQLLIGSRNRYKDLPDATRRAFDRELFRWQDRYKKFDIPLRHTL